MAIEPLQLLKDPDCDPLTHIISLREKLGEGLQRPTDVRHHELPESSPSGLTPSEYPSRDQALNRRTPRRAGIESANLGGGTFSAIRWGR